MRRRRRYKNNDPQIIGAMLTVACILIVVAIHPALLAIPAAIAGACLWFRHKKGQERKAALLWIGDINSMDGYQFEKMLGAVFERLGYGVKHTGGTGDFGVDLILVKSGWRIAVQAKRYSSNVGNRAVQEVYTGMAKYKASEGWVVTNSQYTKAARDQAKSCGIVLVDGEQLLDMITKARRISLE